MLKERFKSINLTIEQRQFLFNLCNIFIGILITLFIPQIMQILFSISNEIGSKNIFENSILCFVFGFFIENPIYFICKIFSSLSFPPFPPFLNSIKIIFVIYIIPFGLRCFFKKNSIAMITFILFYLSYIFIKTEEVLKSLSSEKISELEKIVTPGFFSFILVIVLYAILCKQIKNMLKIMDSIDYFKKNKDEK